MNTNLGIVLLCAPLAAAMDAGERSCALPCDKTLAGLTRGGRRRRVPGHPSRLAGRARRRRRRHDVHAAAPTSTLLEAMREAADRDKIAFQYASDFADIFGTGTGVRSADARQGGWPAPWPAVGVYLAFLSDFPDSHIARKHGAEAAARVQDEARTDATNAS